VDAIRGRSKDVWGMYTGMVEIAKCNVSPTGNFSRGGRWDLDVETQGVLSVGAADVRCGRLITRTHTA